MKFKGTINRSFFVGINMDKDIDYMYKALELAKKAQIIGEVPIGAIVVKKSTGEIVGTGYNRRECDKSPLAHAEIIAINEASKKLGGWRLIDCEIYVTLEPCPMCTGAIINSRLERVIYGASDTKAGSCSSVVNLFDYPYNHIPEVTAGVLQDDCSNILSEFFKALRYQKKQKE